MKTRTFTAGLLLLLSVYYCIAMPVAVNEIAPASCCFEFFMERIPLKQIVSIAKTHVRCSEKAFVVSTAKGNKICVSQNMTWAEKAFEKQQTKQMK
ncbi:hypothetical protein GBF38_020831 [Nibea albiflora]|uniref:Uncharacterized protein n=1 Tax=Nibea albiflora TaxID=240163 RepID=A0ACB7FFI0_NIBAL|nr:hypothetical protein GBF38_020831 [Nibea albiflora]